MIKRTMWALGITAGLALGGAGVANAASDFSVSVNVGPPAVVYEAAPAPRVGYVWAQGYWDYDHGKHVWRKGHWEHERHGERWVDGRWQEHEGHWVLNRGHWERG
jgi:hypothetical protein